MPDGINDEFFSSATTSPNPLDTPLGKGLLVGIILFLVILFPIIFYLLIWYRPSRERFWRLRDTTEDRSEAALENGICDEKKGEKRGGWRAQKRLMKSKPKWADSTTTSESASDGIKTPDTDSTTPTISRKSDDTIVAATVQRLSVSEDAVFDADDDEKDESSPKPLVSAAVNRSSLPTITTTFVPDNQHLKTGRDTRPRRLYTPTSPPPSPTTPAFEQNTVKYDRDELHLTPYNPPRPVIPIITVQHPTPSTTAANSPRQSAFSLDTQGDDQGYDQGYDQCDDQGSEQGDVNEAVTMSIAHIAKPVPATATASNKRLSWPFSGLSPRIVEIGRDKVESWRNIRW